MGLYYPHLPTVSAPQTAFLLLDCREAFYGGACGGGKSDALLMAALAYVDHPGYAALLLRRSYPELEGADGLIAKAHEWLSPFDDVVWNEQKHRYTFPSGAVLQFGHVKEERDKYRYQGQAYQFVGFDELTHFSETQYEYIALTRSRRRTALNVPIRARAASNPGNVGHGWVKRRFVEPGTRRAETVFVPARIADNPGLDRESYERDLSHLPDELRQQLMDGDWDAFEGAAFPDFGPLHLVDRFPLASSHDRLEGMDYGLNGTAWHLVATDYDGNVVFVDSLCRENLLPDEVAPLVLAKRDAFWGFAQVAYADPSLWHRIGARNKWGAPAVLADEFGEHGVPVLPANNDPRAGLIRLRTLMQPSPERRFPDWHPRRGEFGAPSLYVVGRACPELVEQLASAPLQPQDRPDGGEKIDPEWESRHGHSVAAARYAVMVKPPASAPPEPVLDDPRAELLRRVERERDGEVEANRGRYQYA